MKVIMKKFVILLLLILLVKTTCFSQNIWSRIEGDSIVLVTPKQLKETNLIFAEHYKLLNENSLLYKQLSNYKLDNSYLLQMDSLRSLQLKNYESLVRSYDSQLSKLKDEIETKNRTITFWKAGSITVGVGLLIWLLLK